MNQGYPYYPQQPNVIPMQIHLQGNQQQQQKNLFQTLDKGYKYQIIKPSNDGVQSALVYLQNGIEIKMDLNYNVSIPPLITIKGQPYIYTKFFQWNNQSTILNLIQTIEEQFNVSLQALSNPVIKEFSDFVLSFNIDEHQRKIRNLGLNQLLPALQQQDYSQYLQSDEKQQFLKTQLLQISEMRELKDKMVLYTQHSENIANVIESNDKYLEEKIDKLNKKNDILQEEQSNNVQLQTRFRALCERFQDSKVYQQIQGMCEQFDEESNEILDNNDTDIEEQMSKYLQGRKKYQKILIIGEKFKQMKQI